MIARDRVGACAGAASQASGHAKPLDPTYASPITRSIARTMPA